MSLINRKAVKEAILDNVKADGRGETLTRVGAESFDFIEARLLTLIAEATRDSNPPGKTITLGKDLPEPTCSNGGFATCSNGGFAAPESEATETSPDTPAEPEAPTAPAAE